MIGGCSSTSSSTPAPTSPSTAPASSPTTGIAGLFTFEGPHDVFLPLAAAAAAGVDDDLMTNVAIAMPRSPMHLANAAYDLQLMSGGRFRLGPGLADQAAHREAVRRHLVAAGRADARDRAGDQGDPRLLAGRHAAATSRASSPGTR